MKIYSKKYELKLKREFRIAREVQVVCNNLFLKLNINGITGYGEAAPTEYYNEDIETIYKSSQTLSNFDTLDFDAPEPFFEELKDRYSQYPSLRVAVEMAVYDIIGKHKNKPVYSLFDFNPNNTPVTSFTLGMDKPGIMEIKLKEAEQYPILKIKLGSEYDYDIINILKGFRNKKIRIDANEGWEREEAVKKMELLKEISVEFIEQPLQKDDLEGIRWLKDRIDIKIFTDENVKTSQDIENIVDIYDGINIKLMKCGGLSEAVKMIKIAKSKNLEIMLGCMIESSLAITAAAHLSPEVEFADLDGNLLISNDPFTGVSVSNGKLILSDMPGLGVNNKEPDLFENNMYVGI